MALPVREKLSKISDDIRCTVGLPLHFLQQGVLRVGFRDHAEQHLRIARNACQRRIDLVRDAGGKQADARKLFALLQRFLELYARRNIFENDDRAGLLIRDRTKRRDRDIQDQRSAVEIGRVQLVSVSDLGQMPARFAEYVVQIRGESLVENILDQFADRLFAA